MAAVSPFTFFISALIIFTTNPLNAQNLPIKQAGDKITFKPLTLPSQVLQQAKGRALMSKAEDSQELTVVNAADGSQNISLGQIVSVTGIPQGTWVSTLAKYLDLNGNTLGYAQTAGVSQVTDRLYVVLPNDFSLPNGIRPTKMSLVFNYLDCDYREQIGVCLYSGENVNSNIFTLSAASPTIFKDASGLPLGTLTLTNSAGVKSVTTNSPTSLIIPTDTVNVQLSVWVTGAAHMISALESGCQMSGNWGSLKTVAPFGIDVCGNTTNTLHLQVPFSFAGASQYPGLEQINLDMTAVWKYGLLSFPGSLAISTVDCAYDKDGNYLAGNPISASLPIPQYTTPGHTATPTSFSGPANAICP